MAENQAVGIGLKNYLSADDIDKTRFKSPGKLSSNLLGRFDSNPNLASSSKPVTRLSQSSPHLLQADTEPLSEHTSCNSDNSGARKHAGAHITISEPEASYSPSSNEEELLSNSEMVEEKDKKRRKRWKWSPFKKMRKLFGRKKDKRAKSCEDLATASEHAAYKSNEEDSGRDSLRKRTKSEPTLSDGRLKKIGLAVADVHHTKATGGGVSKLSELKKRPPGEGSQELGGDASEEAVTWPPNELQWITSQPSVQEASVSFEETPPRLMLVGLQSAHDKIKAAPKNRRPPTRTNSGNSGAKKVAPMKPHRKSKTNPPQGELIKKPVIGETNDRPADQSSRVVFESMEVKDNKEADQEELGRIDTDEENKDDRRDETNVKVNEKVKAKPLLPPVLKPLLPKEPEKAAEVTLTPSETEKPADTDGKCCEVDTAKTLEEKEKPGDSKENVVNSVRERANQILSAAPGSPKLATKAGVSPKLASKSSGASPKASPRLPRRPGVALKPTPQSNQKLRDEKNKVSDALDDAFDVLEASEDKEPEVKVKEDVSHLPVHRPRPAPRPKIAIKPKLPQKLPADKSEVADALDDALMALETEKTKPEIKEKESKSSGSPTPAPRRALKPIPKSRQKLRDEISNDEEGLGDTSILLQAIETTVEKAKDNEDKMEINQKSEKENIVSKNTNSSKDKENDKDKSARMIVLRSKSDSQMKIVKDAGLKERALIFSSAESDQKKSAEIAPNVPLRPVKIKQCDHENENENESPPWLKSDVGVQLRNKQFLVRDTDNRKTCPPKLLAALKLTGVESQEAGEQPPPWVALANKKSKRLSQILEPEKAAQINNSEKEELPVSTKSTANSKPSVTPKPSEKTDFKPSPATVENKTSLSRSKSAGIPNIQKEKSKSLTRASSEDKPSDLEKQGKHGFVPPKLEKCVVCNRTVYQTERCNFNNSVLHRGCIRCTVCKRSLAVGNFVMSESKVYCKNHVQQTVAAC